jgi:glycosyltransferase involved in cell wall biosynthesis
MCVTVVVPVRDEERTVAAALESLARQTVGPAALEVLVFDGGSTDATAEICRRFATAHPWRRFEVLDNPGRTVPHALNSGLAEGRCEWFAVLAGRTELSPNYLEVCVRRLERLGPAVGVGGRFVAVADGTTARAIAAVVTHPLGVGRGFRTETVDVEIPHHPFAVWRRADVIGLGGFDTQLERNQDDEFCMRAVRRGARIQLAAEAMIRYRPRERFRGLAAQYFQYGLWKAAVGLRYGLFPRRSAAPAFVAAALAASAALAAAGRSRTPLLALVGGYALAGAAVASSRGSSRLPTALALAIVHVSYGLGVLIGAARPAVVSSSLGRARVR